MDREAVVDLEHVHVLGAHAGHVEDLLRDRLLRRQVEVGQAGLQAGGTMVEVRPARRLDVDGRLLPDAAIDASAMMRATPPSLIRQ
jgi:hypothetical protein